MNKTTIKGLAIIIEIAFALVMIGYFRESKIKIILIIIASGIGIKLMYLVIEEEERREILKKAYKGGEEIKCQ